MQFSQVIGQSSIKQQLVQFADNDRIPHALMLSGSEGRGALSIALAFAQYILCDQPIDGDSCGQCGHCTKVAKLIHPDVHYSYPVIGITGKKRKDVLSTDFIKSWRDIIVDNPYFNYTQWLDYIDSQKAQGNINAQECLEIIKKLGLKSFSGKQKILIMWLSEYLGNNGNRLLKLIEEPPDDTVILFITENTDAVLNTILSRFQIMAIPPIHNEDIAHHLVEEKGITANLATQISDQSGGSMIKAFTLIDQSEVDLYDQIIVWLRICYQSRPEELVAWVDAFAKEPKEYQKYFLSSTLYIFREILIFNNSSEVTSVIHSKIANLAKVLNVNKIEQISGKVSESIVLLNRNINVKIMMMSSSLDIGEAMKAS